MEAHKHFLISAVCFGLIAYHFIFNSEIITHPYMGKLFLVLFAVAGINFGVGLSKYLKNN